MYRLDTTYTYGATDNQINIIIRSTAFDTTIHVVDRETEQELGYIVVSPMRETVSLLVNMYNGYRNQHIWHRGKSTKAIINKLRKGL